MVNDRPRLRMLLLAVTAMALSACASTQGPHRFEMPAIDADSDQARMWPAMPEVPRYAFIGQLYGESNQPRDAPPRDGLQRLFAWIAGLDESRRERLDLLRPQQIATDGNGRVYVTDPGRQSIFVFDEQTGELGVWDERSLDIPLPSPIGILVAEESVWVSDSELAVVYRLSLDGRLQDRIGLGLLERPTGLAFDTLGRRLFVSDTGAGDIKLFDPDGRPAGRWGSAGSGPGEFNRPTFLAYRDARLYVVDSLNARVQVLDDRGQYLRSVGQRGLYVGNFSRPKGIALDSDGNLYVAESYYDHLLIYDAEGRLLLAIGGSGAEPGQFSQPTGIWVDARDRVFVSDMLNSRVSLFQYLGTN